MVDHWLLLSEDDSLNELLAFFHQGVWEKRAVDAVTSPASHSVADSDSNVSEKAGVLADWGRVLWYLKGVACKNERVALRHQLSGFVSSYYFQRGNGFILRRQWTAKVFSRVLALRAWVAIIDIESVLGHLGFKVSSWLLLLRLNGIRTGSLSARIIVLCHLQILFAMVVSWMYSRMRNHCIRIRQAYRFGNY